MKRYKIFFQRTIDYVITVEAHDKEEAEKIITDESYLIANAIELDSASKVQAAGEISEIKQSALEKHEELIYRRSVDEKD